MAPAFAGSKEDQNLDAGGFTTSACLTILLLRHDETRTGPQSFCIPVEQSRLAT